MYKVYVVPKDGSKKEKAKAWVKNRCIDVRCFWEENKEAIVAMTPVVIGGVTFMVKVVNKRLNLHQQQMLKDRYVWDPKLGHYWLTNRKLTNTEWTEIERRKEAGEAMGNILASMKVLKM